MGVTFQPGADAEELVRAERFEIRSRAEVAEGDPTRIERIGQSVVQRARSRLGVRAGEQYVGEVDELFHARGVEGGSALAEAQHGIPKLTGAAAREPPQRGRRAHPRPLEQGNEGTAARGGWL